MKSRFTIFDNTSLQNFFHSKIAEEYAIAELSSLEKMVVKKYSTSKNVKVSDVVPIRRRIIDG